MCACVQGNCDGPPKADAAQAMNLPASAVDSLQDIKPGQCVVLVSKSAFKTVRYNKWFDNLRIVFVPDTVAPQTMTAITVHKKEPVVIHPPTNVFMTRMTFQALEGFPSAQAVAVLPDSENPFASHAHRVEWLNRKHSLLFHGSHLLSQAHFSPVVFTSSMQVLTGPAVQSVIS